MIVTAFNDDEPLLVYGDESHDERRERVFAVAGLLGDQIDWKTAAERWIERTGGKTFHASQCESEYANHSDRSLHEENLKLYADLTKILAGSNLLGFGAAMGLSGWRSALPPNQPAEEHAYYKCFSDVVIYFGRIGCLSIPRRKVKFIFDRSYREYNAHQLYTLMRNEPTWPSSECLTDELGSATRETPGIQMADLLVRETMKQLDNEIGPVRRPIRQSMRTLLGSRRCRFEYYMGEYSAKYVASGQQWAEAVGLSNEQYSAWLSHQGLTDTLAHRIRFVVEFTKGEQD
jgi:hypothetical protein